MNEEERIKNGLLFSPIEPELKRIKLRTHNLNVDYNSTYEDEVEKRELILKKMVGELGENSFIQGPVFFHYGIHTHIGRNFFANFNFTVQDDAEVTIGDNCNFGPGVIIVTPLPPMLPEERNAMLNAKGEKKGLCWAEPVHIGHNCWLGASVTVCPGVTIGDGCVIGAGAVVKKILLRIHSQQGFPRRL